MTYWLSMIITTIMSIVLVIKGVRDVLEYTRYTIPRQLVQLVKQAHLGQEYPTIWNIEMSDEMRTALCVPLQQQLHALGLLKDDVVINYINGYVISHKFKARELSGVVCVSIGMTSKSKNCNYECSEVRLRITVSHVGTPGISQQWVVSSVEQI